MGMKSLFRMMAVRAPRPLGLREAIDLSDLGDDKFQVSLEAADTLERVIALCNDYVRGDAWLGSDRNRGLLRALAGAETAFLDGGDPIRPATLEAYAQTLPPGVRERLADIQAVALLAKDSFIAASYSTIAAPTMRRRIQTAVRVVAIAMRLLGGNTVPRAALQRPITLPNLLPAPNMHDIRPAGVADLLIVNQELVGYTRTEIAHVENVMASETRGRTHRTLDRTTQTLVSESESSASTTRDLQTNTRSELSTETTRSIAEEMSMSLGTSISASYGPVLSVDADAEFSYGTSRDESSSTASTFAQDVVDRSVSTLTERNFSSSTLTTLAETEEVNNHGFKNDLPTAEHIVGVYRWLDQRWRAQVMNYGRRLMFNFNVHEPAGTWRWAMTKNAEPEIATPVPPELAVTADQVSDNPTSSNYWMKLAKTYGATDLDPPPADTYAVSTSLVMMEAKHGTLGDSDYDVKTAEGSVEVPSGYEATGVIIAGVHQEFLKDKNDSGSRYTVQVAGANRDLMDNLGDVTLTGVRGVIKVSALCFDIAAASASLRITCARTPEAYQSWQMSSWSRLKQANDKAWQAYDAALAAAANRAVLPGSDLSPDQKREIERTELKRGALNLLIRKSFDLFDPVRPASANNPRPEMNVNVSLEYGDYLSFFEQAFQWTEMTYLFYPYFWGEKADWDERLLETDPDPSFEAFRKAGSSRVQVPVRPGFERAVLYYLATGKIWAGRDAPVIGGPLYVPIVAEIAEGMDRNLDNAEPYGDPWEFTVPTSLVVLDPDTAIIDGA